MLIGFYSVGHFGFTTSCESQTGTHQRQTSIGFYKHPAN